MDSINRAQSLLKKLFQGLFSIRRYNMFEMNLPDESVLRKTYSEINTKLIKYYQQPLMKKYLLSLTPKALLDESVIMFVGSRSRPKNVTLTQQLIQLAQKKAILIQGQLDKQHQQKLQRQQQRKIIDSQRDMVKYYTYYFTKMQSQQKGNQANWNQSTNYMIDLANKGHSLSSFLLAKQIMKVRQAGDDEKQNALNTLTAFDNFQRSLRQTNLNGLAYIASIQQKQSILQATPQDIKEFYMYAAVYSSNKLALYNLSHIYKKQGKIKLYLKTLKKAAQQGVLQAQHDLGIEYLQGLNVKKDQVKALSWLLQASVHDFVYSKITAARILLKGTSCGRVKPNKQAALVYFQEISRSGLMNVQQEIKNILQSKQFQQYVKQESKQFQTQNVVKK